MSKDRTAERIVSPEKLGRLADWSMRKPVIAVMGEFSSGKSTLMNLLLGRAILPTQVTATRMPPVWLRYGEGAAFRVDRAGKRHPVDMADTGAIPMNDTRFVGLYAKADILRRCDLIDTPGISDPNIKVDHWIRTIGYANAVMWCTHSGQAWRESERGMWETLPTRLRQTSILLVTRKDKIRTAADQTKIDRRLEREAGGLFNARIFIALIDALRARDRQDAQAWADSGGKEFSEMLEQVVEGIGLQRSFTLARYVVDDPTLPARKTQERDNDPPATDILGFVGDGAGVGAAPLPPEPEPEPPKPKGPSRVSLAEYRLKPHPTEQKPPQPLDLGAFRLVADEVPEALPNAGAVAADIAPPATEPAEVAVGPDGIPGVATGTPPNEESLVRMIQDLVLEHRGPETVQRSEPMSLGRAQGHSARTQSG